METDKKSSPPLIIAHRGASALAPENTLAAFKLARELGADGIELDVMLSADNELVVIHDATVDRTTNGSGKVSEMTYADMRNLDAGEKFNQLFQGEHLPTLSEVFETVGGQNFLINIELKNYAHPFDKLAQLTLDLVHQYNLTDSVLFSSFNPLNLPHTRRSDPAIKLGLLTFPGPAGALLRGPLGRLFPYDAIHPHFRDVTAHFVEKMHTLGCQVNPWTVDDPQELLRLKQCGVDMIICNDPAAARKLLEK